MEEKGADKVTAFDTLFTTNQIQMMKVLLPYFDAPSQRMLAVYIKFLELQYTLSFLKKHPGSSLFEPCKREDINPSGICDEILPFCGPSEKEKIQNAKKMFENFSNMQEMMQTVQMMQELFPEGEASDFDISQIMNILNGGPV